MAQDTLVESLTKIFLEKQNVSNIIIVPFSFFISSSPIVTHEMIVCFHSALDVFICPSHIIVKLYNVNAVDGPHLKLR